MGNVFGDGDHLASGEGEGFAGDVDEEFAFEDEEGFVGVRVTVPVEALGHDAHADDVVVDLGYGEVGVGFGGGGGDLD